MYKEKNTKMKEFMNNIEYKRLLQKYNELKNIDLQNNTNLFEFSITLDSGTVIHPNYSSAYYSNIDEKHKTLEQLLDICLPIEDAELKDITDIISRICSFSKWGLYFFCMIPVNRDFKDILKSKPLSYYKNKEDSLKSPESKKLRAEEKLPFIFEWMKNSFRYKDEYALRKVAKDSCFYGEKYLLE